jgi:hypothetical protein
MDESKRSERILYCDHFEGNGEGLFRLACENARYCFAPFRLSNHLRQPSASNSYRRSP